MGDGCDGEGGGGRDDAARTGWGRWGFIGNAPMAGGGAGRETKKDWRVGGVTGVPPPGPFPAREQFGRLRRRPRASDVFVIPFLRPVGNAVLPGGGGRVCVCARRAATAKCSFSTA